MVGGKSMTTGSGSASSRKWLVLGLGLSVLFNVGFAVAFVVRLVGFPPPPPPEGELHHHAPPPADEVAPEPPGGPARLKERLGLSEELAEELHEDRKAMAQKIRELRGRVKEEKAQLFHMVATEGTDMAALKERTARISDLQREVQDMVVEHLLVLRGKLDAAQKKKFDEFVGNDLCGCPMCDGGCLGGRMEPGPRGPHRRGHEGPGGGNEGCGQGPFGGGAGQCGGGAGQCGGGAGECGCGSFGGVIEE
jgi:hypothetical protein